MSVEKRVQGGTTTYLVRWRDTVGAPRSRSFDSQTDATAYDVDIHRQRRLDILRDPLMSRTCVGEFAEMWLSWQTQLKPKTIAGYRSLLDSHVLPTWRNVRLDKIDYASVAEWVSGLCHKPGRGGELLSASQVRQAYHLLTGMLEGAVAARWLSANPARGVPLPSLADGRDRRSLSHAEVAQLADRCGPHRLMVLLMAYTGLRWGEVVGLQTADVYIEPAGSNSLPSSDRKVAIHVDHAVADVNGTLVVGMPKSHQRRTVDVPPFLRPELIAWTTEKAPNELVFPSRLGGPLRVGNFRRDWFDKAAREIGFPGLTPIALRHTAATLAFEAGANVNDVRVMLGHKDASRILARYGNGSGRTAPTVADRMSREAEKALEQRPSSTASQDAV